MDDHFRSVLCMLTSGNKIKELRTQDVPYEVVTWLLSIGNVDTLEALTFEYLGSMDNGPRGFSAKSIRLGAQLIARECPKLKILFFDLILPNSSALWRLLRSMYACAPILTIMGNILEVRPAWISLYSDPTVWTGYSHMALNNYPLVIDKPLSVSTYCD